jgi:hypothetical protein
VRSGHARDESDVKTRVGIPFDNGGKRSSHSASLPWPVR